MATTPNRLDAWLERQHTPRHRFGVRAFRWTFGLTLLYQFLVCWAQRNYLYGPEGVYPFELFEQSLAGSHFSVLAWSRSTLWFELVFHGTIAALVVWTLGWRTTLTTPIVFLGVLSLHNRNPGLWDGGDNVMQILLVYAIFMLLDERWSSDSHLLTQVRGMVHNGALLACRIQISIVYFVAGVTKLSGEYWQNGTAFYYVLASEEFGMTTLGPSIWNHPVLLSLATWAPVALQLAFPWIYFFGSHAARRTVVIAAVLFHLGIFYLMGLATFAAFMIGAELLLLNDADYRNLRNTWDTTVAKIRKLFIILLRIAQSIRSRNHREANNTNKDKEVTDATR